LLRVQPCRHFNHHSHEQIAALTAIHMDDAFGAKFENLAALRTGRHFQYRFAFEGRNGNFTTECCERERDGHFAIQIVFLALKNSMLGNVHDDIKIALRSAADSRLAIP